ncbi:MAG: hypothetical protein DDG59_03755 [Anaerolineae bacterium]|jgi:DNA-binding transcriptional ArsR family regulator/DNA-binding transcriptional MerR regulator|nr:MAG: hypothetical protein DDG59_03755 [Anaerolineae bacterium]
MSQPSSTTPPALQWDFGSAYDLFISLKVLHEPARVGLRPSWAAGVRSRLPQSERKFLEDIYSFFKLPLSWVYRLPHPKDAATALFTLRQIPPAERLAALSLSAEVPPELHARLREVQARRTYDEADVEAVRAAEKAKGHTPSTGQIKSLLQWWSRAEEFGERYLEALQAYYQVFFAEEERRIEAPLRRALQRAQALAEKLPLQQLIVELSQGVEFDRSFFKPNLILAPAYWSTPLLIYLEVDEKTHLILFGGRPPGESLIAGETVPESLTKALKALADPTRLRILRYLEAEPHTPSQLARKLRLRAPTVIHHLTELRLAGLVQISVKGETRLYTPRKGYLEQLCQAFEDFLRSENPPSGE